MLHFLQKLQSYNDTSNELDGSSSIGTVKGVAVAAAKSVAAAAGVAAAVAALAPFAVKVLCVVAATPARDADIVIGTPVGVWRK